MEIGPIRVLIADDHPVVREGLAALIERCNDMTVAGEAEDGEQAIRLFRQYRPDVTLMDLNMPLVNGVEAIRAICGLSPRANILVLTTYDGDEDIYRALQGGAKGYLLKDAGRDALLDAIRSVHQGQHCVSPKIASKLAERMSTHDLTSREQEVLHQIASAKSNCEIGRALYISEGTVKAHVNSLLRKLGVSDRTEAVTKALKRGIIHIV